MHPHKSEDSSTTAPLPRPSGRDLLLTFAQMSLSGFGGVLPWARRMIVEQRRWMSADEFNDAFALCQFLPGPNIVNFAVVYGSRVGGWSGACLALLGLLGPPLIIVLVLGAGYARFGDVGTVRQVLLGLSAAAAGLIAAVSLKMAAPLIERRRLHEIAIAAGVFTAIGILRLPLPWVLAVALPASLLLSWRFQR